MARSSIVGSGSYMPTEMYLMKNEMTEIYDDPNSFDTYMRRMLIDRTSDKPLFESDMPRYNNLSRHRLNNRDSESTEINPKLDDAFLDFEFLNPEPSGGGFSDFKKLRQSVEQHIRNIYIPDTTADNSISEQGYNNYRMNKHKQELFKRVKQDKRIFDTSLDYIQIPSDKRGQPMHLPSNLTKVSCEENPKYMCEEAVSNRNWQVEMSNKLPVGWQRVPDQIFTVSKYDTPRKMADSSADNFQNLTAGKLDTDFIMSFENRNLPRSVVLAILDITRNRKNLHNIVKNSLPNMEESRVQAIRKIKQLDDRLMSLMRRHSANSATTAANVLLRGEGTNRSNRQMQDDPNRIYKSQVGLMVASLVKQASDNRKLGQQLSDDLRLAIKQTATNDARYNESSNAAKIQIDEAKMAKMSWMSLIDIKRKKSLSVFNYALADAPKRLDPNNLSYDHKIGTSKTLGNRQVISTTTQYAPDIVEGEYTRTVDATMRNIGSVSRSNRNLGMIDNNTPTDIMSDLVSRKHSQFTSMK